jgi:hypothetical protein
MELNKAMAVPTANKSETLAMRRNSAIKMHTAKIKFQDIHSGTIC